MVIAEGVLTFILCGMAVIFGMFGVAVGIDAKEKATVLFAAPILLLGIVTAVFQGIVLAA